MARAAAGAGLSGVVVTPGPDLAYACGYRPLPLERLTALVVATDSAPLLIVPQLERPDAVLCPAAPALRVVDWPDGADPYLLVASHLRPGRYAVSDGIWGMHLLGLQRTAPAAVLGALTDVLPMLRAVKDDQELKRLAIAALAADRALTDLLNGQFAGRTEAQVADDLAGLLLAHGHSSADFTLVCSGPNSANPHHLPGQRVIEQGDVIVCDFGGYLDGYASDTTRTLHVGQPTAEVVDVHEIVRAAQQAAFEAVGPGVSCQDVDQAARRVIVDAGYGPRFIHRTGHGIGMSTHEPPYLVAGQTQPLVEGMCFSIEPGIYLPGRFGVRIEDIVTVTATGGRRLNHADRHLHVVA